MVEMEGPRDDLFGWASDAGIGWEGNRWKETKRQKGEATTTSSSSSPPAATPLGGWLGRRHAPLVRSLPPGPMWLCTG
jgi:hypothetical protein